MRLLFGIGNPGPTYSATRHNAGWLVLDELVRGCADPESSQWVRADGPYLESLVRIRDAEFALIKPLTFVNLSGDAAVSAMDRHSVSPDDLLVIIDDVHLPPGDIRLRRGGSSGGHNGMTSLIEALGTDAVPRLRIGIGAPPQYGALIDYVLSPFTPEERPLIEDAIQNSAKIAEAFGHGGYAEAGTALSRWKARKASEGGETLAE